MCCSHKKYAKKKSSTRCSLSYELTAKRYLLLQTCMYTYCSRPRRARACERAKSRSLKRLRRMQNGVGMCGEPGPTPDLVMVGESHSLGLARAWRRNTAHCAHSQVDSPACAFSLKLLNVKFYIDIWATKASEGNAHTVPYPAVREPGQSATNPPSVSLKNLFALSTFKPLGGACGRLQLATSLSMEDMIYSTWCAPYVRTHTLRVLHAESLSLSRSREREREREKEREQSKRCVQSTHARAQARSHTRTLRSYIQCH